MAKYCEIRKLVPDADAERFWKKTENSKDGRKWTTLRHNGVIFPEPYEPLPKSVRIKFRGKPVKLDSRNDDNKFNVSAEEAALYFASKIEQDQRLKEKRADAHADSEDPTFRKNFWKDWKIILGKNHQITSLSDVDFTPMVDYLTEKKRQKDAARKAMSKEERAMEKQKKEAITDIYGYVVVDGTRIRVANPMVEIPGLYIGHGKNKLRRGKIKRRTIPSDVTLNVSLNHVPKCMTHGKPCRWGDVVENRKVTWLATWKDSVTGKNKYIALKREVSHWVCANDQEKFDKARKLEENISSIRKKYKNDMRSNDEEKRQLATAVYLLDEIAIRPGTEKNEKEADTVGLTTLKCSNVTFKGKNTVKINFTGKSSIKFDRVVVISPYAYENLQKTCAGAAKSKALFPNVNDRSLNDYLKTLLPGLTAKVFRTWKASTILQHQLFEDVPNINTATHTKKLTYDRVNIAVAKALNHKRMSQNTDRIKKLKTEISQLKKEKKAANTPKQKAAKQKSIDLRVTKLEEAEGNVAMSTSKVNYLDPRITVAWAKTAEMPIEKLYNKTQLQKFLWAMKTEKGWRF